MVNSGNIKHGVWQISCLEFAYILEGSIQQIKRDSFIKV